MKLKNNSVMWERFVTPNYRIVRKPCKRHVYRVRSERRYTLKKHPSKNPLRGLGFGGYRFSVPKGLKTDAANQERI